MIGSLKAFLQRLQLSHLIERPSRVPWLAVYSFVNGCISIGLMAAAALVMDEIFVFPSLGPTAFLFFYTPLVPAACPRNAIVGHAIGAACGWLSLVLFGLTDDGAATEEGVTAARAYAAALSLGLTSGLMVLVGTPHPPAGATTLIVSLGILHDLDKAVVLMLAVVLLTLQAFVINRLAGLPYPIWSPRPNTAP